MSDLAVHSIGAVGCAIADLIAARNSKQKSQPVVVDQRLASLWFARSIEPVGWSLPPVWDAVAGDYPTKDGWIKLHTNLPHHREAACRVLGVAPERGAVAAAVSACTGNDLETAIVEAGGVAALMRSRAEWQAHAQGMAVASEPLVAWTNPRRIQPRPKQATTGVPLEGLRVLDLTRVLAGPVATRTLAGFGASVLRIDPPGWGEPNVVPDITLGKTCATLDLRDTGPRQIFEGLLREADVLVHGYRPDALERLGIGKEWRRSIAPNLVEVCLDAYGWSGPWAGRRGFDSLVQMSSGIADSGMMWARAIKPTPLPVQALDHATGYLMAAAVLRVLVACERQEPVSDAKLSLARTAELLASHQQEDAEAMDLTFAENDWADSLEQTPWGAARRLKAPLQVGELEMTWRSPACELGSAKPQWAA
ncbi:CoA transferase [Candidatus Viadribacter manganicus]|uniref:CoA transferase n=1 Tax=Candidatus Viadribacter manganicus TaxID=1759059 RepID=UPI001D170245|nr:CoA transferase [Candidatus Viadribacter manganicus]